MDGILTDLKESGIEDIEGKKEAITKALRQLKKYASDVRREKEEEKRGSLYAKW